ncbi:MAG: CoA:oxalate CoA-transferase [Chloroflexi bacterium]|nr:MAG: CoA:oxalate CoA-transferase [Chloroflexota bacterium]
MGAEVIKVEKPGGEEGRQNPPFVRGQSAYWVQYNSGKKSITLNLRDDGAKELLKGLVRVSDIFIQNFRPGVIQAMGLGYDVLKELNPRIIMVNVSAFGQYGPYVDWPGFDPVGQAVSGQMYLNGWPDTPPLRTFFPLVDRITSLHAAIGALAALRERELSGEGQAIDVCLADSGFSGNEIPLAAFLGTGQVQPKIGNQVGNMPPSDAFPCKDGWVFVIAGANEIFRRLCTRIGKEEWLTDPRFADRNGRVENKEILLEGMREWLATQTVAEAVQKLTEAGIPSAPINDIPTAAHDPHLTERECLVEVPDPIAGTIHVSGKLIKMSRSENVVGSAPMPGQHNQEIYGGLLGLSDEELEAMAEAGSV